MKSWQFVVLVMVCIISLSAVADGIGIIITGDNVEYDFFDKIIGDLEITGFLTFKTPLGGFQSDNEAAGEVNTTLSASNTPFQVGGMFDSSIMVGNGTHFTTDTTNGNITILSPGEGIYNVMFGGSVSATKTGTYHCWIDKNGIKQEISWERTISSVNQVGVVYDAGHVDVIENDVLCILCETSSGANPILTFEHMKFKIQRVSI